MRPHMMEWALNPISLSLKERKKRPGDNAREIWRGRRDSCAVVYQAESPQGCLQTSEEEERNPSWGMLPQALQKRAALDSLIPDFSPPQLWEMNFCGFKALSWWHFLWQPEGTNTALSDKDGSGLSNPCERCSGWEPSAVTQVLISLSPGCLSYRLQTPCILTEPHSFKL